MRRSLEVPVDVPSAVLAVVLLELAVGGGVLLWVAPTWGAVRHGYEVLLGGTLGVIALLAWLLARAPLADVGGTDAHWAGLAMLATAAAGLVAATLIVFRVAALGRVLGIVGTVAGVAALVPLAAVRDDGATWLGVVQLLLGAFFLGAVWDALILGHWYLVERRLSNRYMVWMAWANVAAVIAGLASVALSASDSPPLAGLYSPLLAVGSITTIMGVGLVLLVAMTAGFNVKLAREGGRSIQAATGMSYLAVIMAPAAEFAAKIRFF